MTRCALLLLALVALPMSAIRSLPADAQMDPTVIIPAEAHGTADQQAAITYARELIAAGQMDRAVTQLADFVASHPNADEAARFLGDLYYRQGRFDRAEATYKQILARSPRDKETHNRLGVVYATENRVDEAISQFEKRASGDRFDSRSRASPSAEKATFPASAGDGACRPRRAAGPDSNTQEELGEIFQTLHQANAAILYFRRALDSDATSIAALNGVAMAYLDLHDHATAIHYLGDCLNIDPTNYACLDNLGVARIQAGSSGGGASTRFKRRIV